MKTEATEGNELNPRRICRQRLVKQGKVGTLVRPIGLRTVLSKGNSKETSRWTLAKGNRDLVLWAVLCSSQIHVCKSEAHVPQNVIIFGDTIMTELIKLK